MARRHPYLNGHEPGEDEPALRLDTARLLAALRRLQASETLDAIRRSVADLHSQLGAPGSPLHAGCQAIPTTDMRASHLASQLNQIAQSRTVDRAHYYLRRLITSITEEKTSGINNINLNRWKEYTSINTESLWIEERRDRSGAHMADYWGNFIPQIPRQMMLRYTRQGEWVLDAFAGLGTTLIEGRRLGRHTLGVELQEQIVARARERVAGEPDPHGVVCELATGDSTTYDYAALLAAHGQRSVQLVLLHPPYFDIIKFSDDPRDLANARSLDDFLAKMGQAVANAAQVLDRGRYLALVIGDKYAGGEWVPLGFQTMQEVVQLGFTLKSIIVKNFEETAGKRKQQQLWRYRALRDGFFIFKHEYIFLFRKH